MKYSDVWIIFILVTYLCSGQSSHRATTGDMATSDSNDDIQFLERRALKPLDSIRISVDGRSLDLFIFEYLDSIAKRRIKDFDLVDPLTSDLIFRPITDVFFLKEEIDPINGAHDSITISPAYHISGNSPLTIDLDFITSGDLGIPELSELTYDFFYAGRSIGFLRYTFGYSDSWRVDSSLRFQPRACLVQDEQLLSEIATLKQERKLAGPLGIKLLKTSFVCHLNQRRPCYSAMSHDFDEAFVKVSSIGQSYTYHPFVNYFDIFLGIR